MALGNGGAVGEGESVPLVPGMLLRRLISLARRVANERTYHEREVALLDRLLKDRQAVPLREQPLAVAKDVAFEEVVAADELEDAADDGDLREVGAVRAVAKEVDLRGSLAMG